MSTFHDDGNFAERRTAARLLEHSRNVMDALMRRLLVVGWHGFHVVGIVREEREKSIAASWPRALAGGGTSASWKARVMRKTLTKLSAE